MKYKYGIRHATTKTGMLKEGVFPPRLSEWTEDVNEAQRFEFEREAEQAAWFIKTYAFNVEVFEISCPPKDDKVLRSIRHHTASYIL